MQAALPSSWHTRLAGILFHAPCRRCGRLVLEPLLGRLCRDCWSSIPDLPSPRCPRCSLPNPGGRCRDCAALRPVFSQVTAPGLFESLWRDLIHDYKFHGATSLRRPFVLQLESAYRQAAWAAAHHAVVHVPVGPDTLRHRGYDQTALLADGLSRRLGLPWLAKALAKKAGIPQQARLDRSARLANLAGAFSARFGLAGKSVLLIDDILTTGATAQACARLLLETGASRVDVLVLARSV